GSPWLGSVKVGGVLAFAPTLGQDIWNNYNHHATLDQKFNFKQFAVDSAKNQTGNLASVAGGYLTIKIATLLTPGLVAGAPLVFIGLAGAVALGVVYNHFKLDQKVASHTKSLLDVGQ
ncbi:MAG TPA: hypothetical protein VFV39_10360, partial [Limnobacter sp.]|nr:hypothetical protein [Limnobacter sp.]